MTRTWYDDATLILYLEQHWGGSQSLGNAGGPEPALLRSTLERVRPDALQCIAKGSAGYVPYPTRFGNTWPPLDPHNHDGAPPEPLQVYRDVTRELGIRLILGCSGLVDQQAAEWRPEWRRLTHQSHAYHHKQLCPNSGYVEEQLLPQLEELIERYEPDGIWLDAENWTVQPCYCYVCESEFQMLHARSAPIVVSDSLWAAWIGFHRDSFQRYVSRVARYVHDRGDGIVVATNGGYTSHQPDAPPEGLGRLTWDLSPAFALRQAGLEARVLGGRSAPFDLATWSRCSARPWPVGNSPALPAYPKSVQHLCQEGAVIAASGGRWTLWTTPHGVGHISKSELEALEAASGFAREMRESMRRSVSAAVVAVLHSEATHRDAGNGLYDPGPSLDRVRGAHQLLQELHLPHDILNEETLPVRLDQYLAVVLPEQTALPPELEPVLEAWVRRGGALIASGKVAPRPIEAVPTFALETTLGVRWTGQEEKDGWWLFEGEPLRLGGPVYGVSLYGAETVLPVAGSDPYHGPHAAVTRNCLDSGRAYYFAGDFFTAYSRNQYPGLRRVLGRIFDEALSERPLRVFGPPTLEVTLRQTVDRTLVHVVNLGPGKSLAQNSPFIEEVPSVPAVVLEVQIEGEPAEVRLRPGETAPQYTRVGDRLRVELPPIGIHAILEIVHAQTAPPEPDLNAAGEPPAAVDVPEVREGETG
jgi:hypothetical protein